MRYPPLLITIFFVVLVRPFASHFVLSDWPAGLFHLAVFLTLIYAFRHIRTLAVCLVVLGIASVTLRFAGDYWSLSSLEIVSQAMSFVALTVVGLKMLAEVLSARSASSDLVIGAVCLYFVIGLAWTFLYYSIFLLWPDSIFISPNRAGVRITESKFTEVMYFSLSALTTIGSSGEEALTRMAHQLSVVESAMGQLYLAVLVSRLVGFSTAGDAK